MTSLYSVKHKNGSSDISNTNKAFCLVAVANKQIKMGIQILVWRYIRSKLQILCGEDFYTLKVYKHGGSTKL
jgi:hypothetical protein